MKFMEKFDTSKNGLRGCVRTNQRKPQISPLRFAPVEMTNFLNN
jgi:hypothetical protein